MRIAAVLGGALLMLALTSCVEPDTSPILPAPAPSSTPVFASDEEALAAAEALYSQYLEAENALGQDGWADLSEVKPFLRGDAYDSEVEAAQNLSAKGYTQVGEISFDIFALQSARYADRGNVLVTVYLCLDVTNADTTAADGQSVVSPDRPDRVGLEVDFDDTDGRMKISRSEVWSGTSFC